MNYCFKWYLKKKKQKNLRFTEFSKISESCKILILFWFSLKLNFKHICVIRYLNKNKKQQYKK